MSTNNKKEYIFPERYKEQLTYVLGDSFVFNIGPFDERRSVKIGVTGETGILTIRKVRITMSESLLPGHCNPELVEQALAYLEVNLGKYSVTNNILLSSENKNYKLLEILGEYIKNDRFDLIGYKIAVGLIFAIIPTIVICSVFMAIVFSFPLSQLGLIVYFSSLFTAFVSCALGIIIAGTEGALGVKSGRWVGDLIKGKNREPSNLQDLDERLNELMNEQEKAPLPQERLEQGPEVSSNKSITHHIAQVKEEDDEEENYIIGIRMAAERNPGIFTAIKKPDLTVSDATNNANDSSQQVPKNMPGMK